MFMKMFTAIEKFGIGYEMSGGFRRISWQGGG